MWLHAMIAGPVSGILSRYSWESRNQNRSGGRQMVFATWYHGSVGSSFESEVVRVPRSLD
jgi:hypothetical protein